MAKRGKRRDRRVALPKQLLIQILRMRQQFPGFRYDRRALAWYGELQPTTDSPRYRLRVGYFPGDQPRVRVLAPALVPEARALHRYQDGSLCLYHPEDGDWTSTSYVADTIIPWAAEWLLYYECWLADPERRWLGPEAPHGDADRKEPTAAQAA